MTVRSKPGFLISNSRTYLARAVAGRAVTLLKPVSIALLALAISGGGVVLTRYPLFEIPGYELASAMTLALALFSGISGIFSARQERLLLLGRKRDFPASYTSGQAVLWPLASSFMVGVLVLLPPFVVAAGKTLLSSPCSPWAGASFYLLLPLPTVLLASATGIFIGFGTRKLYSALLIFFTFLVISIGFSLWSVWSGPQVFALNHFFGYFPGPLYDESLPIESRLLIFRAHTLLWTALILVITTITLDHARGSLGAGGGATRNLWPLLCLLSVALFLVWVFDCRLGLQTTHSFLEKELSGKAQSAHFVLHFPKNKPPEEVQRLERDLEFSYSQVAAFLESEPSEKIEAWFYQSATQKRQLVGASQTSYAKPWHREFHVLDEPFPHPLIRHEMAHVMASTFGSPLLKVSARNIVSIHVGILEGLAVAAEPPGKNWTIHEMVAAMRRLHLATDIRALMEPAGFYGQAPAKAYIVSGSFIRFLRERYGAQSLRLLYPRGDFENAFGKELSTLATEWEQFLDSLSLDEQVLGAASALGTRPSIFEKPCARELAMCRSKAEDSRVSAPESTLSFLEQCSWLDPLNPAHFLSQASIHKDRGNYSSAQHLYEKVLSMPNISKSTKAYATLGLGEAAWAKGDLEQARIQFEQVLSMHYDRSLKRMATIQLEALRDPTLQPVLQQFFANPNSIATAIALGRYIQAQPKNSTTRYLLGRQFYLRQEWKNAAIYLEEAWDLKIRDPEIARETLRLLSLSRYMEGDLDTARQAMEELTTRGTAVDREFALDWLSRYQFEKKTYGGAILGKTP